MNALQAFITRAFNLQKPVDKRLIWAALGVLAVFGYLLFSGQSDGAGSSTLIKQVGETSSSSQANSQFDSSGGGSKNRSTFTKPSIYVHIVGFVRHPGLYRLDSGARVVDAVFAADGFSAKADQSSINLARILTDGEQVFVTGLGNGWRAGNPVSSGGESVKLKSASGLINLNRADEASIESLPGVGPTLAARIVDWRLANGGFKSKADLQKVSGIGDKLFAKLKDLVVL